MAIMFAASIAIKGIAWAIDELIVTSAELEEKATSSAEEFNRLTQESESLNRELKTTNDRIKELEEKPSLSFIEQEELQKLRDASEELRNQIELNKTLANVSKGKARDSAIDFLNSKTSYEQYGEWDMSSVYTGDPAYRTHYGRQNVGDIFSGNQLEVAKQQLLDYEDLLQRKQDVENRIREFQLVNPDEEKYTLEQRDAYNNLTMELRSYENALDVLGDTLYENVPKLDQFKDSLNPDYDQALIKTIDEIIHLYSSIIGNGAQDATQLFSDIWESTDFSSTRKELEKLSKAGELTPNVLESNEEYKKLLDETGKTADEVVQHINSLVEAEGRIENSTTTLFSKSEMISAINGISEGFEALDKIMNSQKGKNPFDFSLLDDKKFNDNFNIDALKDEYSAFVETISNSPKDVNACKDAYDNLITSWIKSKGILDGISEETASVTEAMLKNMGVANSDVLVQEALTKAKANSAYESNNLSNATSQEIIGLINESGATDEARESFGLYIAQKMVAEAAIDTSGDISALANVVSSLGLATSAWQRYYAAKQRMAQITVDPNFVSYEEDGSVVSKDTVLAQYSKIAEDSLKEYAQELEDKAQKAIYSGGNKSNSSSGSGSGSKKESKELKEEFNWLQRLDEYYQKQHDIQSKIAEDETASYSERIAALKEMTNLDKERMGSATKTASEYLNKWNEIKEQLDPKYISKIMYGDISDEEITALEDSDLADQIELIKQGIDYYDKWQDAEEKKLELQEECTDRLREELELQQELIQAQQEMLQSEMDIVQSKIDYIEASGGVVTAGYYEEQIRLSKQISDSYEDQIDNLRKQQEMVKDESAEYYSLESQINDCEKAIIECKTQQAEWNEAIKRLPVERMQKYINMLKAIKQELEDFLDYQETIGQPTTKDQFQQLIEINQEQIESLQKQAEELQGLLGDYKYGSEKFNDVANELSDIQNETASLVNQMQEYNQEILNIPVNKLEKVNGELERYSSILSGVMDDYNSALNAVTNLVDKQVESLEDLKEQTEKTYQDQIDPLQEQLDLLEKTNEARSVELELEQAKYDLERAQNQKTTKVVRNGQIQYEANESDIRDTKEKLQDAEFNKLKYDIQSQIDYLEEQRDKINEGYDDEIDRLNDISDKWEKIRKDAEAYADTLKADDILGSNWQDKVLYGNDDDIYNMFKNLYESTNQQQVQVDEQIASNERIIEMMQVFIDRFTDGSMTYEQALSGITELAESMNQGYTALEQLNGMLDIDGIENLAGIAGSVESQINESVSMLAEYIDVAKVNNDAIAEYTSTWEEMSQMIDEQLKALKEAAEALEKWVAEQKYNRNSYSSDGDGGGWSGSGVTSNGVYDAESHSYSNPGHSNAGGEAPSSANDDQDEDDGPGVHHGGSMAGYLGDGNSEIKRLRDIQFLCNEDLSPDEVLIKGLKDEICLTKEEQMRLIGNFNAMSIPNLVPVDTSRLVPVNNSRTNEVTINMGDINLPDVRDVDGFAREMGSRFNLIIGQELGKR